MNIKVIDNGTLCFQLPSYADRPAGEHVWLPYNCVGIYAERAKSQAWYKRTRALDTDELQCFELFFHRQPTRLMWIGSYAVGTWDEVSA